MPPHFIDSHVHFWDPVHLDYRWLAKHPTISRLYRPEDLFEDAGKTPPEGMIFIQADCANDQAVEEVSWITALARSEPRIQAIVGFAPLEQGRAAKPQLEMLKIYPLVRGIRRIFHSEPPGFCRNPHLVTGIKMLEEYEFSFDLSIRADQISEAVDLVERCPEIDFVLDHAARPDIHNSDLDEWSSNISRLATNENVYCKLSGLVTEANWDNWTLEDLQPFLDRLLHSFGPDRLMFGGDWPVVTLASTYSHWVETVLSAIDHLSAAEKEQILYKTAEAFYRLIEEEEEEE